MSELLNLFPAIAEKQYFQNSETKEFWFHATAVCNELGFQNPGRTLDMYCDDDEKFQEVVNGRVVWFVSEAGCYGLAMAAKTEKAKAFKRWLKHDVLPKLRASSGYIMPNATGAQLQALQQEIINLQNKQQKILKVNKDCATNHLILVFLFRKCLNELTGLQVGKLSKGSRERKLWDALYGMKMAFSELFGNDVNAFYSTRALEATLTTEKLNVFAEKILNTDLESYFGEKFFDHDWSYSLPQIED